MVEIFKAAIQRGASDLHIKAGDFLRARITGELVPMTQQRLTTEQVRQHETEDHDHRRQPRQFLHVGQREVERERQGDQIGV